MTTIVLDTGALLQLERPGGRVRAELDRVSRAEAHIVVPVNALAQAWRGGGQRQTLLHRALNDNSLTVQSFTEDDAKTAGWICAVAGNDDVVDASVAVVAAQFDRRGEVVLMTSDREDIAQFLDVLNTDSVKIFDV